MSNLRFLVVEDQFIMAEKMRDLLSPHGSVTVAKSPDEAKKFIGKAEIDIALVDLNLVDDMDGVGVAKLCKEKSIYTAILTASEDDEVARTLYTEGINDYFTKGREEAADNTSIYIRGETGAGKSILAKAIHRLSGRDGELIEINCASINDQLFESLFFGHKKGAFTGALSDNAGYLLSANNGTFF